MSFVHSVFVITNILGVFSIFKLVSIFFERKDVNKSMEFLTYALYYVLGSLFYILFPLHIIKCFFNKFNTF